ncbi:MAG TPA: hypothetical protein VHL31_06100 [Geminicoccus sp.]|jgi:hypothetical protein|uniref:hypothetical protein n=1 Tax=Geminicoccus sp. TaxID=2024832 RepID=UPI002E311668|nr:hypothetical protein [Geminicoccus sp.]HEX2525862.1 hypothetical protein [Geminicoccus sp.]
MAELRTACLEDLVDRLRHDLGERVDLADRLEHAFVERDADMVAKAMDDLENLPGSVRLAVHEAILDWLFGGDPAAGLRAIPPLSDLPQ